MQIASSNLRFLHGAYPTKPERVRDEIKMRMRMRMKMEVYE